MMKKVLLCILVPGVLAGGTVLAQDISGNWQGTLQGPNAPLRTIVQVSKADKGLSAKMYSIDQGGGPMAAFAVSLERSVFKFAIPAINGSYVGQLSPDGSSIVGTWTQASPVPLTLVRATKETAWEIPLAAPTKLMAAGVDPSFEVATIKPSDLDKPGGPRFNAAGRNFASHNTTLGFMIQWAYGLQAKQMVGAPEWVRTDRYDITAIYPDGEGEPDMDQIHAMLAKLIVERFKLSSHHEKREMPAYVLTIDKGGPKMAKTESTAGDYSMRTGMIPGGHILSAKNATMVDFAGLLQRSFANVIDRPVVDQTGIAGKYDFVLKWATDDTQVAEHLPQTIPVDDIFPGLFQAIQQQLGLKLDAVKIPVDVMVIDRAEKPSGN